MKMLEKDAKKKIPTILSMILENITINGNYY